MKISVLQHAASEGPGEIGMWAARQGHAVVCHHLYRGEALPEPAEFDALVVMGGEMNIYEYRVYPWLRPERVLIERTLSQGRPVVGICLGAQLIADALGARVTQNGEIELGWFPISITPEGRAAFPKLPEAATVLHWHGDTFELPAGATRLAVSSECPEQGFVIPGKCLALQFHLETDPALVRQFVEGQGSWPKGPFVQTPETILRDAEVRSKENLPILHALLNGFFGKL